MSDWRHIQEARQLLATETGAEVQDWGGRLPIVLAYPNTYAVGMSSLAMHSLYHALNALPGVVCERAFASLGRGASSQDPLITLESQRAVADAAALAISVSFEMDYFNVVQMLRRARIPASAQEREEGDPLVILGGPAVSANPMPMAPIADAIVIGEAEELLAPLVDILHESWSLDRHALLAELAKLEGVFVPQLHDGQSIARQFVADLDAWPTASHIVAPRAEFGDMHLVEISRGCGRGCRFCLAGYWYRPRRERSLETVLEQAQIGIGRGLKIGLVASAVSDYSQIDGLVTQLRARGAHISISSLRVKPLSPILVEALAASGAQSLTLAPEAGSERLRRLIQKGVEHDDVVRAAALATEHGFRSLKLYFMVGLPTETDDDVAEILRLTRDVGQVFDREVIVNITPFVPKAHTAFQHVALTSDAVIEARLSRLRDGAHALGAGFRSESPQATRIQALLSRGDAATGEALLNMRRLTPKRFERGLADMGLDPEAYLAEQPVSGPFAWDMIDAQLPQDLLQREWRRAERLAPAADDSCPPEQD